jgi:hypothetical protein
MQHFKEGISNSWINCVHKILSLCGISNKWVEQNSLDKNFTIAIVRQRLSDQFIQKLESDINNLLIKRSYEYTESLSPTLVEKNILKSYLQN